MARRLAGQPAGLSRETVFAAVWLAGLGVSVPSSRVGGIVSCSPISDQRQGSFAVAGRPGRREALDRLAEPDGPCPGCTRLEQGQDDQVPVGLAEPVEGV